MKLQLFKFKYCCIYVEGEKPMIAEVLINKMYTTEPSIYLGEFERLSEIYKVTDGFVEGVSNQEYNNFIEQNGLVNLMSKYWDRFVKEHEEEH